MRRIFTTLAVLFAFLGSAWGQYIWFPQEVVNLPSGSEKKYSQEIWYDGENPNAPGYSYHGAIPGQYYDQDYDYSYELISGNLTNINVYSSSEGVTTTFDGSWGSIKITAHSETYRMKFDLYG